MSYFVSPPDERVFAFETEEFIRQLERWDGMTVRPSPRSPDAHVVEWELEMPNGVLYGGLDHSHDIVHMDGDIADCAVFAIWLRTIIPQEVELLFYDHAYSADVPLLLLTEEWHIVETFRRAAG